MLPNSYVLLGGGGEREDCVPELPARSPDSGAGFPGVDPGHLQP